MRALWRWIRALTGDDAYERYVEHRAAKHPGETLLTRGEYFDQRLQRKWSGVTRCC